MTTQTDNIAVDASFTYFKHNCPKHKYDILVLYKNLSEKHIHLQLQQKFLKTCLNSEILPKFIINQTKSINPKTCNYKRQLQFRILEDTLKNSLTHSKKLEKVLKSTYDKLLNYFTSTWKLINFQKWLANLKNFEEKLKESTNLIHKQKLGKLGIHFSNNSKLVYNLSSTKLSSEIMEILEKGPKFVLKSKSLTLYDKVELEHLCQQLGSEKPETQIIAKSLQQLYHKYEKSLNHMANTNVEEKEKLQILQKDNSIVLLKSDKGNSLVVADKEKYIRYGENFLKSKEFLEVVTDRNQTKYKKLCTFLLSLKKKNKIQEKLYNIIYPKTSRTPIAYFLPKTHKADYDINLKFRPIISSYNSYCYKLSKYLAQEISNCLTINNASTDDFIRKIRKIDFSGPNYIKSLDIESMYPSIPLDKAINLATQVLFEKPDNTFEKETIRALLLFCTKDITFTFNDKYYQQISGLAMGSPLAPVLANLYFENIEKSKIFNNDFPFKFKFYYRYMDDLFFVFKHKYSERNLLNYFNAVDNNLKFTIESESNNVLPYLDILIINTNKGLETRWYRKPSHTLQYSPWDSIESKIYKIRLIYTMVNRLSKICSTTEYYKADIALLRESFINSGYPVKILDKHMKRAIKSFEKSILFKYNAFTPPSSSTTKQCFVGFYYNSFQTELFSQKIRKLIKHVYPQIKMTIFYKHGTNLISMFSSKIKSKNKQTDLGVYKISCKNCGKCYIGETGRSLLFRLKEHENNHDIKKSAIAYHRFDHKHEMDFTNSRIIYREPNTFKRKIAEALLIGRNSVIPNNSPSYSPLIFK